MANYQYRPTPPTEAGSALLIVKEERNHWIWVGGIGAVLTGLFLPAYGGFGVVAGLVVLGLGIATLYLTRFGGRWQSLTSGQKTVAVLGMLTGIAAYVTIGILVWIVWRALSDE
jgi:hypothetical protein